MVVLCGFMPTAAAAEAMRFHHRCIVMTIKRAPRFCSSLNTCRDAKDYDLQDPRLIGHLSSRLKYYDCKGLRHKRYPVHRYVPNTIRTFGGNMNEKKEQITPNIFVSQYSSTYYHTHTHTHTHTFSQLLGCHSCHSFLLCLHPTRCVDVFTILVLCST